MKMPAAAIREEIMKSGAISFARFMELALYCPETGYYETKKDIVGQRGDFITSVSAGSLFGELLAFQFAEWLRESEISNLKLQIVEAGAHDGKLAADILNWLQIHRPELFARLEYCLVEPSETRRRWQNETLEKFKSSVRWFEDLRDLSRFTSYSPLPAVFFSNELLDAFPVHRLGWDAKNKNWFEWGVAFAGEKLAWTRLTQPVSPCTDVTSHTSRLTLPYSIPNLPSALLDVLPDNYTIEISPAAESWWREAAGVLARGKLLTIDYGYKTEEQFSPSRPRGTLRAYFRQHVADDLLANPGEQDLTAHVNFSAIQKIGQAAGLKTETLCAQPQFLTRILQKAVAEKSFAAMDAKRVRQFQTLTHPEHLGRAFRVLVQSR